MKKIIDYIKKNKTSWLFICIYFSLGINLVAEIFNRRSLLEAFKYIITNPHLYLYASIIILLTYSLIFFTKRRIFYCSLITMLWLIISIANGVVLSFRNTPFTVVDISLFYEAFSMVHVYLKNWQIVLCFAFLILVLIGIILTYIFAPKYKGTINYKLSFIAPCVVGGLVFIISFLFLSTGIISSRFTNIALAYKDYGFTYCFSSTMLNSKIDKPDNYSQAKVSELLNRNKTDKEQTAEPNIVFIQLESFFDPKTLTDVAFSANPTPNYDYLRDNFSSGELYVPTFGAGTINTEFEILSGMSLDYFGTGQYPYKTIIKKLPCETIAYNLIELGYSTHAIHNNRATFYDRYKVYMHLGFQTFTSQEYMNNLEFTDYDWCKDSVLTNEIMTTLKSTSTKDFIFAVSVQPHGPYPEKTPTEERDISITVGTDKTIGYKNSLEYFVNQVYDVDKFVKDIYDEIMAFDEDTILVFYGDHLPTFSFEETDLKNLNLLATEYVIISNFDFEKRDENLEAFQLNSSILERLGIDNGIINHYNQNYRNSVDYLSGMHLLEYDMLYGKQYAFTNNTNPYEKTDISYGHLQIRIRNVIENDTTLSIYGNNFTPFSKIIVNDDDQWLTTTFVSPTELRIDKEDVASGDSITVGQIIDNTIILSQTKEYIIK